MNYRIEAALAALKNATPGPWDLALTKGFASFSVTDYTKEEIAVIKRWLGSAVESDSNALLIAAAPDLAAEVIRLRKEVARLTEKLKSYQRADESISQALNEGKGEYKP